MKAHLARVLAVEDHPEIGDMMRLALARARIEATLITMGEEALAVVREQPFDLILLDFLARVLGQLRLQTNGGMELQLP